MTDHPNSSPPPDVLDELTSQLLDCGGALSQIISHAVQWDAAGRSDPDAAPAPDVLRALIRDALGELAQHHARYELRRAASIIAEATTLICENIFLVPLDLDGT
jgi:hypothetical protein